MTSNQQEHLGRGNIIAKLPFLLLPLVGGTTLIACRQRNQMSHSKGSHYESPLLGMPKLTKDEKKRKEGESSKSSQGGFFFKLLKKKTKSSASGSPSVDAADEANADKTPQGASYTSTDDFPQDGKGAFETSVVQRENESPAVGDTLNKSPISKSAINPETKKSGITASKTKPNASPIPTQPKKRMSQLEEMKAIRGATGIGFSGFTGCKYDGVFFYKKPTQELTKAQWIQSNQDFFRNSPIHKFIFLPLETELNPDVFERGDFSTRSLKVTSADLRNSLEWIENSKMAFFHQAIMEKKVAHNASGQGYALFELPEEFELEENKTYTGSQLKTFLKDRWNALVQDEASEKLGPCVTLFITKDKIYLLQGNKFVPALTALEEDAEEADEITDIVQILSIRTRKGAEANKFFKDSWAVEL